jgi:hypothetical protein
MGLIFLQLDYRLEDDSLKGVKLVQSGTGDNIQLRYEGPVPSLDRPDYADILQRSERRSYTGYGDGGLKLEGPGIIRKIALNARRRGAKLRMRFDGEKTYAVDADLADFLGPFRGAALNNNRCYFPMPFKRSAEIEIAGSSPNEQWELEVWTEPVDAFDDNWRYFHAQSAEPQTTNGYDHFQVLSTHGRGHWIGMALYETHHDHGGGDITVVDGNTDDPAFLHGINGEDYFSFAFFGQGENFPYSEAFDNDTGRMRVHLENPYPFDESIHVAWGMLRDESPRAVSWWYQDTPINKTVSIEESYGLKWSVFGQVYVPVLEDGNTPNTESADYLFHKLPDPARLDRGESIETYRSIWERIQSGTFEGWATQYAVGPVLDLMYVYRHVMDLGGASHMAYEPRAMMAKTELHSDTPRDVTLQLSYDDPLEVVLNGQVVYTDLELRRGFTTRNISARLNAGDNTLLVRMLDTPNVNTAWAAIAVRVLDAEGRDISEQLQPNATE